MCMLTVELNGAAGKQVQTYQDSQSSVCRPRGRRSEFDVLSPAQPARCRVAIAASPTSMSESSNLQGLHLGAHEQEVGDEDQEEDTEAK